MTAVECYLSCLLASSALGPIVGAAIGGIVMLLGYVAFKRHSLLFLSQIFIIFAITASILVMVCPMFHMIWLYGGAACALLISLLLLHKRLTGQSAVLSVRSLPMITALENEFNLSIHLLDSQRTRAYTNGSSVFLSIGLIELLDEQELRAVVAHEAYHVRYSHNMILGTLMSLLSFTFVKYKDEYQADRYAAELTGIETLAAALSKLDIHGWEERVTRVSRSF